MIKAIKQEKKDMEAKFTATLHDLENNLQLKEKELVSLKQLFLFNVPSLSLRFTPKKWDLSSIRPLEGRISITSYFEPSSSTNKAMLHSPLEDLHLVEEHKEKRSIFRKEQKAVWARASSFCLGKYSFFSSGTGAGAFSFCFVFLLCDKRNMKIPKIWF